MTGDGVVYQPAVPVVGGNLVPALAVQPKGTFLASPTSAPGAWQARQLTAADFQEAIASLQTIVDFGTSAGKQDTTALSMVAASWVKATSVIVCTATSGTPDHPGTDEDAAIEGIIATAFNILPGIGFSVVAYAPEGSEGRYNVNCIGVN